MASAFNEFILNCFFPLDFQVRISTPLILLLVVITFFTIIQIRRSFNFKTIQIYISKYLVSTENGGLKVKRLSKKPYEPYALKIIYFFFFKKKGELILMLLVKRNIEGLGCMFTTLKFFKLPF